MINYAWLMMHYRSIMSAPLVHGHKSETDGIGVQSMTAIVLFAVLGRLQTRYSDFKRHD